MEPITAKHHISQPVLLVQPTTEELIADLVKDGVAYAIALLEPINAIQQLCTIGLLLP